MQTTVDLRLLIPMHTGLDLRSPGDGPEPGDFLVTMISLTRDRALWRLVEAIPSKVFPGLIQKAMFRESHGDWSTGRITTPCGDALRCVPAGALADVLDAYWRNYRMWSDVRQPPAAQRLEGLAMYLRSFGDGPVCLYWH